MDEPPLHYDGIGRLYGEPFVIGPKNPILEFSCRNGTPFFNERIELRIRAAETDLIFKRSQNCLHRTAFTLSPDLFTSGVQVFFLEIYDHYKYFRCRNRLIAFGEFLALPTWKIPEVTAATMLYSGANLTILLTNSTTNELTCVPSGPIGKEFQVMQWWTTPNFEQPKLNVSIFSTP